MLNIASSDSLVDKLTLVFNLNDLLVLDDYYCSFIAKLNWKKKCFFQISLFFTKYTLFAEKNVFICKEKFTEKNINENVKNI